MSITSAPTIDNLKIAEQLLAAMTQVSAQLESQLRSYTAQAAILDGIVKAQAAMNNLDPSKAQEVTDALKAAQAAADAAANSIKGGTVNVKDQASETDKIAASLLRAVAVMGEFANGFKAGFNLSKALLGNLLRIGSVGLKGIMGIGKALLSIPGSILSFFQKNTSGGSDPWREAIEELRDKFGALQMGTSKAVLGMMDNVSQFNQSGLKLGRVFGHGRAGAAAILKEFSKIAEEMGPSFMPFANAVKGISGELLILTKSTGLSGAALKTLQISADNGGESVKNAVENMNIGLVRAQRTFGISAKEMGKDLEIMMKDVGSFGIMSRDSMIKTSVYVKKLGLSMDALKKVMDKTLNFEDAANSAAGMAEAFNMNIDAFKLMKEQDPTKKLDMMRQAFFRTGKNIDQMSIAERKHLANLSNLSEEEARIAFAQKNRAMTGASLDAQMKKSSKTQITQEEAMHELADSIKRLVVSGGGMQGGFFEMFFKGFEAGITRSREFRQISREIQKDLKIVWRTGRDVGAMFVELFPGIKDMFGGLRDMLNPAKFTELMNKIRDIFGSFFIELQTDPRKGFEHFMERMKKAFFDMFSSDEAGGSQFLQGLKKFWGAIGNIFVQGLRWLLIKATAGIKFILDSIRRVLHNPRGIKAGFKELFDSIISPETSAGAEDGIMSLFGEIMQTLATEILPVLKELWNVIVEFFEDPAVQSALKNIGMAILGYMFGPAVFMAVIRGSFAIGFELLKAAFFALIQYLGPNVIIGVIVDGLEAFLGFIFSASAAVYLLLAAIVALFVGFAVAPEATGKVVDWITDFLGGLGEMIGKLVGYIIKGVVYLIGGIVYLFLGVFFDTQKWLEYANRAVIALIQAFASVGMMIVKFFGDMVAGVLETLGFPGAAAAVRKFTKSVVDEVKDFIKNATEYFDFFSQMVEDGLSAASDIISEFLQPLIESFSEVASGISDLFSSIWGGIKSVFNTISGAVGDFIDGIVSAWDSITEFVQPLIELFSEVASGISDLFSSIWGGIKSVFNTISGAVGDFIDEVISPIYRTITSVGRSMGMILDMIISGIISFAGKVIDILDWPGRQLAILFSFIFNKIISFLSPFIENLKGYFTTFSNYVSGLMDKLVVGIRSRWDSVVSSISGVIDQVIGIFSLGFETMKGYFNTFSNYVSGKIDGALGWIRSKWDSTISAISSGIDAFGKGIDRFVAVLSTPFTVAGTLIDAAGAKITRMIDTVKNDFEIALKWISDHNPFKLIANAAESAEAVIRRIHGHSMNTVIANDLNKIDASPFERLSKGAEDTFNLVKSGAAKGFELLKTGAQSALKAAGDEMSSFLNNPIEHIKTRLSVAGNIIKNTFQSVQDSVKKILTSLLDDPISFIQDKLKQLKFWIIENSPFPSLTGSVNGVIDTVIQKIEMFRENINTAFKQVKDNVILAFTDPVQFIKNSIQSYADIVTGGFKNITDVVNNVKKEIGVFLKDPVAYVKEDLKNLSRWIQEHNPFALIGRAAEAAAAIVHGIHGHCMNVIIKKDLNKIDASPIAAIGTAAQNSSAVVTQSFAAAARNSNTHVQQIQRNSTTASAAATTAVTPNPHALQQATAGVGQAATAVSQLQNTNVENNAALLGIFGQLRDVINGMVNFVKDAFKDLTPAQATNIKAGVEVISSLFTSIKTIIDIVGSVKASDGSVNIYNAVVAPLFGPNGILSYLFDPAHGEAVRFKEMVKTGGMISVFVASLPANFNEQITKITSVFNFIKSIGDAMSSLRGQTTLPAYNQVIGPLIGTDGILSFLFNEQHAEAVTFKNMFKRGGLISKFVSTLPSDFNVVVAKLISLFAAVKSITESVKTLTDIQTPTALTASPLNIPLSNLALIIENIKQDTITANGITVNNPLKNPHAYFGAMETIYDGLAGKGTLMVRLKDVISEIFTSTKTISELPTFASGENLSNSLVSMTTVLNQLDDSFGVDEGASSKVSRITSGINNRLIADVRSMVTQYNSFSRELAALDSINIDATLSRFGEGLAADRQVVLNQAAANVTVNLKITLTAEDIAKALYARVDSGPKAGRPGEFMTAALRPRTGDTIGN